MGRQDRVSLILIIDNRPDKIKACIVGKGHLIKYLQVKLKKKKGSDLNVSEYINIQSSVKKST